MKFNDIRTEEKVRLDPKCWKGKKIGNPKTKMKGGVRVNNCVPAESIAESTDQELRRAVYQVILDIHFGAKYGENMIDTVTDELGDYFDDVEASDDDVLKKVYAYVRREGAEAEDDPARMDRVALNAIEFLNYDGARGNLNEFAPGMTEEYNAEYDDEAGMAQGSLHTLKNAVEGLASVIDSGDNLPEWCQEKISLAEDYLVTVWDYLQSEKAQGVDPEIAEMYEAMDQLAEEMSRKHRVSVDTVWETFEAMPDNVLYETAAWRRKEGKSKSGGLNAKGVASYRREHPGSKLQTAVTTKPSKLKKGSKAAKRRKSFCARMSGVKGPMKKPNGKPTRKALALRKWNC